MSQFDIAITLAGGVLGIAVAQFAVGVWFVCLLNKLWKELL